MATNAWFPAITCTHTHLITPQDYSSSHPRTPSFSPECKRLPEAVSLDLPPRDRQPCPFGEV
jgi:hypothetical protein